MGATLHTNHIGIVSEPDDAAFTAAARSAVPALLDRVAELEAGLRDALEIAKRVIEDLLRIRCYGDKLVIGANIAAVDALAELVAAIDAAGVGVEK